MTTSPHTRTRPPSIAAPFLAVVALLYAATGAAAQGVEVMDPAPISFGETFTIRSAVLDEVRRINVYLPAAYTASADVRLPVLYMPDGGMQEDFLHIAGLVQISTLNGTMRPFILVGIENTQRRRDLTGPTSNGQDSTIAPVVGGSGAFRRFLRTELMPAITARYRTTEETAIVGESLAGLFVVETYFREPDLFDTYIAFDPSLWWNDRELVRQASGRIPETAGRTLYIASSSEEAIAPLTAELARIFERSAPAGTRFSYHPMPEETHATIYHPAALRAFRELFRPARQGPGPGGNPATFLVPTTVLP